jgi:hypothetical protein
MKTDFKIIGPTKPASFTCELPNETMFRTKSRLSEDRFNALFNYCKGDWSTERLGEVEHEGLREDGTPKNPIVLSIKEF